MEYVVGIMPPGFVCWSRNPGIRLHAIPGTPPVQPGFAADAAAHNCKAQIDAGWPMQALTRNGWAGWSAQMRVAVWSNR